ncbi:elongator complex protein 6-like [Haliotis rubra]|uniref:elongator complex protein 6-like n=1 Tax=Haliotis rubra TaxID=36100 RepID=UPI001EE5D544|nr:elongator complex protein 6-like [Haliotis rubra]
MISEIDNILSSNYEITNEGSFVGIADSSADGSFLIHYFLNSNLRKGSKVCFIGFAQSFNHYSTVAQKQGVSLNTEKENGNLVFIEGMKYLGQAICHQALGSQDTEGGKSQDPFSCLAKQCSLQPLLQYVKSQISYMTSADNKARQVLIIDNLSLLINIGVQPKEMVTFLHYLKNSLLNIDIPGQVIVLLNVMQTDEDAMFLWKYLCHSCSMTMLVSGLPSGYCRDVHGELTIKVQDSHCKPKKATTKSSSSK